jgi:hypothetical protein
MGWEGFTIDALEQYLIADELEIGRRRARQMSILGELDVRQTASGDGARSLSEWVSARMDVGPETAKSLVQTMRRLADRPDIEERLAAGETTFDRVEALSRIPDDVGLMQWADVAGVRHEAAKRVRITAESEFRTAGDRFLVIQPNLDESWFKLWGGLDGYSGGLVDKVLTETADRLPDLPDGSRPDLSWRKATALVETLISDDPPSTQVTVFVDAHHAAETNGQTGVTLDAGVRVGRQGLQAVLCDAVTGVTARTSDGRYMDYGRTKRTAPPRLKRALLAEYGFRCAADGCHSRYRLQVHHKTPWMQGGHTDQDDLIVLCWYHHQVVVHERGFHIIVHQTGRVRFAKPEGRGSPI